MRCLPERGSALPSVVGLYGVAPGAIRAGDSYGSGLAPLPWVRSSLTPTHRTSQCPISRSSPVVGSLTRLGNENGPAFRDMPFRITGDRRAQFEGWIAVPFPGSLMDRFPVAKRET